MIYLIALVGQFIGLILAKFTKEELKQGKIYFNILKNIILVSIIISTLFYKLDIIYLILGLVLALVIKKEYFYFGLISNNLLFSSLIFIYGLPYGSLNNNFKKLIYNIPLFLITLIITFIYPVNFSLSAGALIVILVKNLKITENIN